MQMQEAGSRFCMMERFGSNSKTTKKEKAFNMCTVPALAAHGINLRFACEPARIIIRMFGRMRASCCANVSKRRCRIVVVAGRQGPIQSLRRRYLS